MNTYWNFNVSYIDLECVTVKYEERRRQEMPFLPGTKEGRFKQIVLIDVDYYYYFFVVVELCVVEYYDKHKKYLSVNNVTNTSETQYHFKVKIIKVIWRPL